MFRNLVNRLRNSAPRASLEYDHARVFAQAWNVVGHGISESPGIKGIAIVNPAGSVIVLPAPKEETISKELVDSACRLIPREPQRTVSVIAETDLDVTRPIAEASKTIPFMGLLVGLATIGHRVIIFDGTPGTIEHGCRGADVMIIDGTVLPRLGTDWYMAATQIMRRPEIYMHDRNTFRLRPILPNPQALPNKGKPA